MAARLSTEPLTITQAQAVELCGYLAIDGKPAWETYIDPQNRSAYDRHDRATLRYAGSDPLLQGAALDCWALLRAQQYNWSVRMHAGPECSGKYIKDTLPYNERDRFVSSINISASKPLPRIAKELSTRLLAHYLPAYRHAMIRLQEETDQQAADLVLAEECAAILRTTIARRRSEDQSRPPSIFQGKLWPMSFSGGQAHLERQLHLSPQQARELCALVATWTED